ncbi:zinc ABC transporter substrate-binding protein [Candidatus Poribacteria bacterium]|nr:zinc ABC transporter substrate-binding protein [Candidatus Poribacteria bacterium]
MPKKRLILISLFIILTIVYGCSKEERDSNKLGIVVSIVPLQEFTEKIGGDKVTVNVMVPPGASPHSYEPTPNQLVNVSKAKMYVKVGTPVEFELVWLDKIISTNVNMVVVDASKNVKLHRMNDKHDHEKEHDQEKNSDDHKNKGYDPHIWLSPKNAIIMVENIHKALISLDPKNKEYYTSNKEAYIKELNKLDSEIKKALSSKKVKTFMVFHPAWGYFARSYNLEQMPIEEGGKNPTARGIQNLINQAKEYNAKVIFASPQFSTKSAEVIAKEIKGHMVLIDPLKKDYINNLRKVSQAFSEL